MILHYILYTLILYSKKNIRFRFIIHVCIFGSLVAKTNFSLIASLNLRKSPELFLVFSSIVLKQIVMIILVYIFALNIIILYSISISFRDQERAWISLGKTIKLIHPYLSTRLNLSDMNLLMSISRRCV